VLAVDAAEVDRCASFPERGVRALHEAGLMALMALPSAGPNRFRQLAAVAAELGGTCLSTATAVAVVTEIFDLSPAGASRV
jgi:alkylation response protein AidB-like acyl-CoA dehydrogenase